MKNARNPLKMSASSYLNDSNHCMVPGIFNCSQPLFAAICRYWPLAALRGTALNVRNSNPLKQHSNPLPYADAHGAKCVTPAGSVQAVNGGGGQACA